YSSWLRPDPKGRRHAWLCFLLHRRIATAMPFWAGSTVRGDDAQLLRRDAKGDRRLREQLTVSVHIQRLLRFHAELRAASHLHERALHVTAAVGARHGLQQLKTGCLMHDANIDQSVGDRGARRERDSPAAARGVARD